MLRPKRSGLPLLALSTSFQRACKRQRVALEPGEGRNTGPNKSSCLRPGAAPGMSNYAEERASELEVLESIFPDELERM